VALLGVAAPTAKISKCAGLAEGTLFTYFANKDELLNHLFMHMKINVLDTLMNGYPSEKKVIDKCRHVWNCYVDWGTANTQKHKAVRQLAVSERISSETRNAVAKAYEELDDMIREVATRGALRDLPPAFALAILDSTSAHSPRGARMFGLNYAAVLIAAGIPR
jgi:AcrR family transcriptional regulator